MAKKNSRRPSGAAAIQTIEDEVEEGTATSHHETNGESHPEAAAPKPRKSGKSKGDQASEGSVGVADIKKAAAFVNSIGGLDKAIALLQILKVAKEVQ